ncbi:hypothetical protein GINT2_002318 [Glugoides intestinalis]
MQEKKIVGEKKISLSDLITIDEGKEIDMTPVTNLEEGSYNLIKDEIEDFVSKAASIKRQKREKSSFFEPIGSSVLRRAIDKVLKTKNIKEELLKKNAQQEFDAKMARIKKIKSKTYRKMKRKEKLKKESLLETVSDLSEEESEKESEDAEFRPVFSFDNKKKDSIPDSSEVEEADAMRETVEKAFETPGFHGNELEFLKEKAQVVKEDAPQLIEHYLPGWGSWAGDGIETQRTNMNTFVEIKDGIEIADRKDHKKSNVIINEHIVIDEKYKSTIPYGYSYKEYKNKLNAPISLECTSLRIFNRFVKHDDVIPGQQIEPVEFDPKY